jgi:hypothetical protein
MTSLFDLNKKGTIAIGNMRSGSNLVVALTAKQLTELEISYQLNGEYFFDINNGVNSNRSPKYCYFNMLNHLQEINNTNYSIGTIIYPKVKDMIAYNHETWFWCNRNFHLVKIVRRNYMEHFMSRCIFQFSKKQYGVTDISEIKMPIPYSPTLYEINSFIDWVLEVVRFPCNNIIEYENLPHDPVGYTTKNIYNIEPKDFFADYKQVSKLLSTLKYNLV